MLNNGQGILKVERSHRHLHLSRATAEAWGFADAARDQLEFRELSVLGEYATIFKVEVPCLGPTTVLYPWRDEDVLEVAMSEYLRIHGEYAHRRNSNQLLGAKTVTLTHRHWLVEVPSIVVWPHAHGPELSVSSFDLRRRTVSQFPLELRYKPGATRDNQIIVHLDNDQFNALQGMGYEYV